MHLPLWVPDAKRGMLQADSAKATAEGLTFLWFDRIRGDKPHFRPLLETIEDTLLWAHSQPGDYEWRAGLSPACEAEVLAA
jgi:hypothetical protein